MKIRNLLLLSLLTVSSTMAFAQEQRIKEEGKTVFKPHWSMQVQAGAAHTAGKGRMGHSFSNLSIQISARQSGPYGRPQYFILWF